MDLTITDVIGSRLWTINFYREQLKHFAKVGLGNLTQHDVRVTESLIAVTEKRLKELTTVYDGSISYSHKMRKRRAERKLFNGQRHTNNNGTTASPGVQDNGNTRHERKKP